MTITTGTRFGHYEVTAPLGKGGMGEVCLAEDTRLNRKVALKLLPTEFTQDSERLRRFALEAQTASGLNHPNIITIYDIGQAHDTHYIATEYIAGQTLREHLRHPLPLAEALDIALQIAQALTAAHEANIIHRDIKPENVMLRKDGIVKVLDFGLAKLTETRKAERGARNEEDVETLLQDDPNIQRSSFRDHPSTTPGVVMGTANYMSPEQARGQRVDARTDLFSLGVVLYEMLAGKRPFAGVNTIDVLGAILHETPAPIADVPVEVQRIVSKALQKDRAARYKTAQEFAHDLRELKDELAYQARNAERLGAQASRLRSERSEATASVESASADDHALPSAARRASVPSLAASETATTHRVVALLPGARRSPWLRASFIALAVVVLAVAAFFYFKRSPALTDKDTILLADFTNTTNDPVFDGTLKQALAVHLGQSPFLNLFADERVRETLRLMNRSPDERITPIIGREICQRQGLKAMLTGTIASLGRNYVINLEAVNGQTGDVLAREQGEAEGKEQVLRTLGEAATRLREKMGESLSSMQRFNARLEQVTTSSLDAFKAFSLGNDLSLKGKYLEAIPFFTRAITLDPNFAYAYARLAAAYNNSGQSELAAEAVQKAFELRERVSERERLRINSGYHVGVTGDVNKYIESMELYNQTYPRDFLAHSNLGRYYTLTGQDDNGIKEAQEAIRLYPDFGTPYNILAIVFRRLSRLEEAKAMGEQAVALAPDRVLFHETLYFLALMRGDTTAMQQQVEWASIRPGEYAHLTWQAGAAAFAGQWRKAREFSNRAAALAAQRNLQEVAGDLVSSNVERAAVLGHCQQSRTELARAAALPRTPTSLLRAGMALALCGAAAQAQELNDEAVKRYPKNTIVNEINLPLIRAALELQRGNRTQAIQILSAASRYESVSNFYQNYLRGQAYLGERNGTAAASEFQTILAQRGWAPTSPLYPLAHLGLARAAVLQGDMAKARKSYQDFFALWKDADADLPVLIAARKEYEKVK